jgi:GT2 family glycosyltransferase/glycosyltransferase involved in cell wall biosynthesis
LKPLVKVAFCSGTDELNGELVERVAAHYPELPLYVVSEFAPARGSWIPYHVNRPLSENLRRCRAALAGLRIRLAGVVLAPGLPYRRMRLMALLLSPRGFLAYNESMDSWMLRPRCIPAMLRHALWRMRNWVRWQWQYRGNPESWRLALLYRAALLAPRSGTDLRLSGSARQTEKGLSVVIPSRNGKELLEAQLPGILRELAFFQSEIIVVDNGSEDGTQAWLENNYPEIAVDHTPAPLSFARAVNRGIRRARYSHVCLLNNDMILEPGFFAPLVGAFDAVPDLFCATAQILFPPGVRREETGKAVMAQSAPDDFPVRCEEPLPGEDLSWVLYGSGGCSLYDAAKLRALGCVNEIFEPAYVEDLDLGYRAWQQGWPTVFVSGARLEHRHRATTSRYYSQAELDRILEINYLRFLATAVSSPALFRRLWGQAIRRLRLLRNAEALAAAPGIAAAVGRVPRAEYGEELFLALAGGGVALFPGRALRAKPVVLVASPYVPFPLSHGAAVRIFNLMRRAAADYDQVLVTFSETLAPPAPELLEFCAEVVVVRRRGSHSLPATTDPETVEEFRSPAFRAALHMAVRKWRPAIAQLEFTQMAQYAEDCAPAKTVLVEHDITFDLYRQLAALGGDWETRRQLARWERYETDAWRRVDRVVTMSAKDRAVVSGGAPAVTLPNGVDLERFRPAATAPRPRRLLFIGSFAHGPNLMAMRRFVREVWPLLEDCSLHIIAGARRQEFIAPGEFEMPGVELEGFVSDVRPAYACAELVIAPLAASAGTNIKVLEAMAMGKAVVATAAGINGLDVAGAVALAEGPAAFAAAIESLLKDPDARRALEIRARERVERGFGWDAIARRQKRMYGELAQVPQFDE